MTNWEKYKEELLKISTVGSFSVKDGEIAPCSGCNCLKCFFNDETTSKGCGEIRLEWLDEEYKEPSLYEDWEIDDPIEVSVNGKNWYKRHFAGIDKFGAPLAWDKGVTSWSAEDNTTKVYWEYARKVEE